MTLSHAKICVIADRWTVEHHSIGHGKIKELRKACFTAILSATIPLSLDWNRSGGLCGESLTNFMSLLFTWAPEHYRLKQTLMALLQ